MKLKIAILAGDGIGPEVTDEAVNILKAVAELGGHDFTFTEGLLGGVAITAHGTPLPPATLDLALGSDAVLLGAVGDNKFNALSPDKRPEAGLLQIRKALGGFANLRPSLAFKPSPPAPRSAPRSPKASTSSLSASSSAASTSASPAGGTRRPTSPSTPCSTPAMKSSA